MSHEYFLMLLRVEGLDCRPKQLAERTDTARDSTCGRFARVRTEAQSGTGGDSAHWQ